MATANLLQTSVSGGTQNALSLQGDGVFFPKASTASRLALTLTTTDKGFIVYDTTDNNIYFWNGAAWESVPSSGDAGANGSVQYNDNGIVSGATNFVWDKVNGRVGVATATPGCRVDIVSDSNTSLAPVLRVNSNNVAVSTALAYDGLIASGGMTLQSGASPFIINTNGANERYRIASDGVATWSNVGGVAGTAMTLNSTGLGIGAAPEGRLNVANTATPVIFSMTLVGAQRWQQIIDTIAGNWTLRDQSGSIDALIVKAGSGNLGIGVTPSAWGGSYKALQLQSVARSIASTGAGVGDLTVAFNAIYDSTDSRWEYAGTGDKAGRYSQTGSGNHRWFVSNTAGTAGNEITDFASAAMTLDASGNLLVGKAVDSNLTVGCAVKPTGEFQATEVGATNSNTCYDLYSTTAVAYRFYVGMGGTVFATNTVISAISDARLKENVQDLDVGLDAILALKPRKFDWKSGKGKDIKGDRGFIAQEFETVFPNLIDEWKDPAPEGEAPYKSVRADLIPVLVKAIQELTARVQTLEAK